MLNLHCGKSDSKQTICEPVELRLRLEKRSSRQECPYFMQNRQVTHRLGITPPEVGKYPVNAGAQERTFPGHGSASSLQGVWTMPRRPGPMWGAKWAFWISGIIQARQTAARMRHPKLLSGHSQMGTAAHFHPWDMFVPRRSRFDCFSIRSRLLDTRLQEPRKLVWE